MNRSQKEEIRYLKEQLGIIQSKVVKSKESEDGFDEKISEMSREEEEEYLRLKNAGNLRSIKNILVYFAVIITIPILLGVAFGLYYLYMLIFF